MVGADLSLEGWKEVEGDKDKLFEVDIFNKPDIYTFPTVCFSFGDISEGYCLPEEAPQGGDDVDEPDVVERSVDDGDADDIVERSNELAARSHKGKKYKLGCDPDKIVRAPPYPAPSELTKYTGTPPIPIIVPDVPCADAEEDCKPNTGITVTNTTDRDMTAVIDNTFKKKNEPESQMRWNCKPSFI